MQPLHCTGTVPQNALVVVGLRSRVISHYTSSGWVRSIINLDGSAKSQKIPTEDLLEMTRFVLRNYYFELDLITLSSKCQLQL